MQYDKIINKFRFVNIAKVTFLPSNQLSLHIDNTYRKSPKRLERIHANKSQGQLQLISDCTDVDLARWMFHFVCITTIPFE